MIPTQTGETTLFDLSVPYTVLALDVKGSSTCELVLESTDAIGSAVLTVYKSYDGGKTLISFTSSLVLNSSTSSLDTIDCSVAPCLVVKITTAGSSGTYAKLRWYKTAINNAGGV